MNFTQVVAQALAPERSHSAAAGILSQIVSWGTRILLFLVPVTFLPWTFEIFEFNKQLVLLVLGVILLVVWTSQAVLAREARIRKSAVSWAVLAFLAVVIVATIFSVDQITSVLGFYGRFNGSLMSVVAYAVLYFLVLQTARSADGTRWLIGSWLSGVGLSALILLLQLFGVRWLAFPAGTLASFTPLGGSLNAVVIVLAASLPLALYFVREGRKQLGRWFSLAHIVLSLVLLFTIDYNLGWLSLAVGSAAWLALVFWKNENVGFQWTVIPSIAILLALVGWPVATASLHRLPVPVEVNLSQSASWKVARQNVKSSPLVGTGPETFLYGFSKYKPENFNDSNFWAFRFDRATSELAQLLSTVGYLGIISFVAVLGLALYAAWSSVRRRESTDWYLGAALAAALLVMVVGNVFYFANSVSATFTWLLVGLVAAWASTGERTYSFTSSPRASLSFSFGLALVVLVAIGVCFAAGRFYLADVAYAQAQQAARSIDTLDQSQTDLVRAINLNPWRDSYRIGLAQVLMAQANREANAPMAKEPADQQRQLAKLQNYIASSIAAARSATELARENVANWEALGSIYRGTVLFARDAEPWVISSFEQAVALEPSNPALYTELGKAYLISAVRKRQQAATAKEPDKAKLEAEATDEVAKAMLQFDRAIQLKANYAPARFQQALALEQQGKLTEAIQKLNDMRSANPQDIDVLFELGSLHYATSAYDKAEEVFTTITTLVPNHANAHFGLALVYQKTGATDKAIIQLEKVLELNPNNEQIKSLLDELRKGAASETVPTQLPTQPKP